MQFLTCLNNFIQILNKVTMHIYELQFFLYNVLKHFSKSWTQMNPQIHTFGKSGISSRLKMHVSTHYLPTPILNV